MTLQIKTKDTKLVIDNWLAPGFGDAAVLCSNCASPDFAVHVHPCGWDENSATITELICIKCLEKTKVEDGGVIDRRGEFKEDDPRRRLIKNDNKKRALQNGVR